MRRKWLLWSMMAALALGTLTACGGEAEGGEGEGVPAPLYENQGEEGEEGEGGGED